MRQWAFISLGFCVGQTGVSGQWPAFIAAVLATLFLLGDGLVAR